MKYEYDPRRRRLLSENDTDDSGIENRERLLPEIAEEPVNEKAERRTMEEMLKVQASSTAWLILLSLRVAIGTSHPRC